MEIKHHELEGILSISGAAAIGDVDALQKALTESLKTEHGLKLDLSALDSCDTACMQLLISARHSAQQLGKRWLITARSSALEAAGAAVGLSIERLAEPLGNDAGAPAAGAKRGSHGGE